MTLEERIALGEDSALELKTIAIPGKRVSEPDAKDVADEFAAAANASGATFVFGVDDKSHAVLGIAREKLDVAETWARDICNDSVKPPLNATIRKLVVKDVKGVGRFVLCVDVPRSLFVHKSPHGYYFRIGSSKREMSPEYLARLFQQRSQSRLMSFDEQIVANASVSELAQGLFGRFRTQLSSTDDQEFLRKIRFIAKDEEGKWFPTVGGILMASAHPEDYLPSAFIQAVAYRGTERNANEQVDARDITGPLDVQIMETCHFVKRNMRIAAIKVPARLDIPQYALNAIFEAVVNAVAHRDYSIAESKIRIHMFSDRIEIFSPGALPNSMTVEELPERQFSRNELICTCLSKCPIKEEIPDVARTTIMDRRGEGVPVILGASRALSKKTPEYRLIDGCELKLTIRVAEVDAENRPVNSESHPVKPQNHPVNGGRRPVKPENYPVNDGSYPVNSGKVVQEELEGFLLQVGLRKDFRENMVRVFMLMQAKDDISYDEISTTVNLSRATVRNLISALKDYRLLKRIGSDKTGHWQTFFPPY